ncbi:MAG: hypothetical protein ACK5IN_00965 [Microbacterium sp.]|uniref:hypothetical protein n=1 Tax=Microbacterium sp. TaxID=51671 RepID=UPI003A8A484F
MLPEDARVDDEGSYPAPAVSDMFAPGDDLFRTEFENVDTSVWDVDADLIWGEDFPPPVDGAEPGVGLDLPI